MCNFFFSSRRRHTRCLSDWISDVCSSDLVVAVAPAEHVAAGGAGDGVIAGAAREIVVAVAAGEGVVAVFALEQVGGRGMGREWCGDGGLRCEGHRGFNERHRVVYYRIGVT